jgi:hypothetical protein
VTYGNGTFLAAGIFSTNTAIYASVDGLAWSQRALLPAMRVDAIAYGNHWHPIAGRIQPEFRGFPKVLKGSRRIGFKNFRSLSPVVWLAAN